MMQADLTPAARRSNIVAYRLHIARTPGQSLRTLALCAVAAIGFLFAGKGGQGRTPPERGIMCA